MHASTGVNKVQIDLKVAAKLLEIVVFGTEAVWSRRETNNINNILIKYSLFRASLPLSELHLQVAVLTSCHQ